jgi:polysaccharide biosynthesis/export protein
MTEEGEQAMKSLRKNIATIQSSSVFASLLLLSLLCSGQAQNSNSNSGVELAAAGKPGTASVPATGVKPHDDSFVIGDADVLSITVWKEPEVSKSVPVRSDGKISLPLAGEVQASGLTPLKLEQEIATKLQNYISEPEVTVIVTQINSKKYNILGQVGRSGSFPLTGSMTVLDAIAQAGGFRDFAKQKSIYILRKDASGGESRMPFNYKEVIKGKNPEQNIKLQPGDTIVVP